MAVPALAFALLVLQSAWNLWLAPPSALPPGFVTVAMSLPMLPAALLLLLRRPTGAFWAGVAALFYFCHGVMEAWTSPDVRGLALLETALAVALVLAVGAPALRARRAARAAARAGDGDRPAQ